MDCVPRVRRRSQSGSSTTCAHSGGFGELDWILGSSSYALLDEKHFIYSLFRDGRAQIYLVDLGKRTFREPGAGYSTCYIRSIRHVSKGQVVFWGKMNNTEYMVV